MAEKEMASLHVGPALGQDRGRQGLALQRRWRGMPDG